jgi:hypothetical protein
LSTSRLARSHCTQGSPRHLSSRMPTLKACASGRRRHAKPTTVLANSQFHTLFFGINRLRSDDLPHCRAKSHCSGAIVQLLCNQNSSGLSRRCTPITSANDGGSCGFAIFRRTGLKRQTSQYKGVPRLLIRRDESTLIRRAKIS